MASWHDRRRQLFFDMMRGHAAAAGAPVAIYEDGGDDVVYLQRRVFVEDAGAARRALAAISKDIDRFGGVLSPDERGGLFAELRDPDDGSCPVTGLVTGHHELASPEYVLVAQQRVQPGSDPEPGAPLPPPAPGDRRGAGVRIAIVDTGLSDQRSVKARLVTTKASEPLDEADVDQLYHTRDGATYLNWAAGHGTFIASLINQVAPGATLLPVRACSSQGFESERNVAAGIDRAVDAGAHIINLSWATYGLPVGANGDRAFVPPRRLHHAIKRAQERGVLVVAAAGNSASSDPMFPAAWDEVVGVAALERDGRRWDHSNYGTWVQASALGVNVRGLYVEGDEDPLNDPDGHAERWTANGPNFATWSGTSFAAPLVAAQIAVVASARNCNPYDAWELLADLSRPAPDSGCGVRVVLDLPGQL